MASSVDEEALHQLYLWVDKIPLSRPKRNLSRDFSDGKVLKRLNFSVPDDVMRKIAQCTPGVVELVLIPLRQRLEERQRRRKQGVGSLQELAPQDGSGYMDVGLSQKARGEDAPDPQRGGQL
uniref:Sperm flagellar 1 n=1 Tax=Nomascus leucogenys TaxID=61853 RepID=G1R7Y1_NOMLE